jgi:hypothetical protein
LALMQNGRREQAAKWATAPPLSPGVHVLIDTIALGVPLAPGTGQEHWPGMACPN